jgi:hypothetical protein
MQHVDLTMDDIFSDCPRPEQPKYRRSELEALEERVDRRINTILDLFEKSVNTHQKTEVHAQAEAAFVAVEKAKHMKVPAVIETSEDSCKQALELHDTRCAINVEAADQHLHPGTAAKLDRAVFENKWQREELLVSRDVTLYDDKLHFEQAHRNVLLAHCHLLQGTYTNRFAWHKIFVQSVDMFHYVRLRAQHAKYRAEVGTAFSLSLEEQRRTELTNPNALAVYGKAVAAAETAATNAEKKLNVVVTQSDRFSGAGRPSKRGGSRSRSTARRDQQPGNQPAYPQRQTHNYNQGNRQSTH